MESQRGDGMLDFHPYSDIQHNQDSTLSALRAARTEPPRWCQHFTRSNANNLLQATSVYLINLHRIKLALLQVNFIPH